MGRGRGRSVYKQPGTRVDRDRTTHKGGIPSSERDLGTKGGLPGKGKINKGNYISRGLVKGFVPCALILSTCIYISCYCVYVAEKIIVFRL
jgi:hypothetical protein